MASISSQSVASDMGAPKRWLTLRQHKHSRDSLLRGLQYMEPANITADIPRCLMKIEHLRPALAKAMNRIGTLCFCQTNTRPRYISESKPREKENNIGNQSPNQNLSRRRDVICPKRMRQRPRAIWAEHAIATYPTIVKYSKRKTSSAKRILSCLV